MPVLLQVAFAPIPTIGRSGFSSPVPPSPGRAQTLERAAKRKAPLFRLVVAFGGGKKMPRRGRPHALVVLRVFRVYRSGVLRLARSRLWGPPGTDSHLGTR
jgi:hypothetical protein